jgi:hypothetical protein
MSLAILEVLRLSVLSLRVAVTWILKELKEMKLSRRVSADITGLVVVE